MLKTCGRQGKAVLNFLKHYIKNTFLIVNAQLWMNDFHQPFSIQDSGKILEEGVERV